MHRHPTQSRVIHHHISGELSIKTTQTKKEEQKQKQYQQYNRHKLQTQVHSKGPQTHFTNPHTLLLPPTPPHPHKLPHQDSTSTLPPQPRNTPNQPRKATLPPQPHNTRKQPEITTFPPATIPSHCHSILPPFIANQIPTTHRNAHTHTHH